jgi:putative ABC transport system permease protein
MSTLARPRPQTRRPGPGRRGPRHLTSGLWLRVLVLLFRFPGLFLAVTGAALVLGLAAAAGHLFLSSAGTASLRLATQSAGTAFSGLYARTEGTIAPDRIAYRARLLRDAAGGIPGLGSMLLFADDEATTELGPSSRTQGPFVRLATRTGFVGHIVRLEGQADSRGWWVPRTAAEVLGVHAGDDVHVQIGTIVSGKGFRRTGAAFDLRVAGIYRDLWARPPTDFWRPAYEFIYDVRGGPNSSVPPSFLLGSPGAFMALERTLAGSGPIEIDLPVDPSSLTLSQARVAAGRLERILADFENPNTQLASSFSAHDSLLPALVDGAGRTADALAGPVDVVAQAGRLVALAVFVSVGVYALHRRRVEFSMLLARGVHPASLGARSAVEALLPATLGIAVGLGAAVLLVRTTGPSRFVAADAVTGSAVDLAVTLAVALVLLAAAVALGLRARRQRQPGAVSRIAARVPWELAVLTLAGGALYEIWTRGANTLSDVAGGGSATSGFPAPQRIDLLVPLFPILFIAGMAGVATRVIRRLLPRLRRLAIRGKPSAYLAGARLTTAPRLALILVTACALAIGIVLYAGQFVTSVRDTARQKALVSVGADSAVSLYPSVDQLPAGLGPSTTTVVRLPAAPLGPGSTAEVVAIDPGTFTRAAFWDGSFADRPLSELLRMLSPPGSGGPLPVVATSPQVPAAFTLEFYGEPFPATVVATAHAFPGMPGDTPMVVTNVHLLTREAAEKGLTIQDLGGSYEIWSAGSPRPVLRALGREGLYPTAVTTVSHVARTPAFLALSWLFGFLEALGVLTGILALVALLMYLESRQRGREVSYSLATRMGLTPSQHRRSVAMEIAAMLGAAFVIGGGLAMVGAFLVHGKIDPLPDLPPAALYRVPFVLSLAVAGSLVAFAWLGAALVQRRADRADVAEVMRVAA